MRDRLAYRIGTPRHSLKIDVLHSNAAVGTQILIAKDQNSILVDVGDGTLRDLIDRTFRFETLKGVCITHEHFDHISGLYSLANFLTLLGRKERLLIAVPQPSVRISSLLRPPLMYYSPRFLIPISELSGGDETRIGSFRVRSFRVSHGGTSSLGYSVLDDEGHRVVISGDTRPCPSLEREVVGADLAVVDSTYADRDRDIAHKYGHMTRSEARAVGGKAKHYILVHNPPEGYFREVNRECRITQSHDRD